MRILPLNIFSFSLRCGGGFHKKGGISLILNSGAWKIFSPEIISEVGIFLRCFKFFWIENRLRRGLRILLKWVINNFPRLK